MREIVLIGEQPLSWNKLYAGGHWGDRKNKARRAHGLVIDALHQGVSSPINLFDRVVDVTVAAYYSGRPVDSDNICAKLYIDGLVGYWLVDDNPAWVRQVTTRSEKDKDNPRTVIQVEEV